LNVNKAFSFPLTNFYDANGDNLTFSVTGLPAWVTFNPSTITFSGKPTDDSTQQLTIIVDDGWNGTTS